MYPIKPLEKLIQDRLATFVIIVAMAVAAPAVSRAAIFGPYTNDVYTLHLWHFDDNNGTPANAPTNAANFDAVTSNPQTTPIVMTNTPGQVNQPAFAGYPPTNFALQAQAPFTNPVAPFINFGSSVRTFVHSTLYPSFAQPNPSLNAITYTCPTNLSDYINTNTGAFTFEALVNPSFNPLTDTGTREIVCGDSGFATVSRAWQFRFNVGRLEFNAIPNANPHQVFATLPSAGPNAAAAGNWYHVAVTYTGDSPTNGDTAKQLKFYWTLMDVTRTNANVLWTTNLSYGLTNGPGVNKANPVIGIGGNARNNPITGVGVSDSYIGYIDEVRISSVCRKSTEMIFNTNVFVAPPIVAIPSSQTNNLIGYGQTLAIVASETGTTPITNQWYQNGSVLPGQTNAVLTLSNITFAANGNYQLFATNVAGFATSVVCSVTVGAAFSGLFDTGVDANGTPLYATAPGSIDSHYQLIQSADSTTINSNAIVWGGTPNGGIGNGPLAGWIGSRNGGAPPSGTYSYQTLFQIDNGDVASATLSGQIWVVGVAGGGTIQAFLNGVETDITLAGNPLLVATPFVITNGLQNGSNALVFTLSTSGGGSPGAIQAQVTGIGNALPAGLPVITNPPASQTVQYGATVVVPVVALGRPPLSYQWYSNNVPLSIPSATAQYLTFVATNFAPSQVVAGQFSADYQVVVSNDSGSVTSSVATVTIQIPPLTVVSAGEPIWNPPSNQTNLVVIFSQPVDPITAATAGNYTLDNGASVLSAVLVAPNEVVLTTSVLNPATSYTLTVSSVKSSLLITMSPSPASLLVGTYPPATALWIRADTGVTTDAGGVNQWNDLSGNTNNLLNPSGAPFEPQLVSNALNGRPVIRFTATDETYLGANDSPTLEITGDMTILAVVNFATLAGGTNGMIVSKTSVNQPAPYDWYATASVVTFLRGNGTVNASVSSAKLPSTGVPHVLDVVMKGTNVSHRLDGFTNGTGALSITTADTGQPLYIGTRADGHNRLAGDLAELIVIGSAVSASDVASLESYLGAEYQLPVGIRTNPTNIVSSASATQLTLSWPADHTGWRLQAQTNGLSSNWFDVANSKATNQVIIPIGQTNGSVFYRLIYP
ncbi:MAG: hypothetical protein QOJ40_1931 [Verrucomicrobiota bacterium]